MTGHSHSIGLLPGGARLGGHRCGSWHLNAGARAGGWWITGHQSVRRSRRDHHLGVNSRKCFRG